MSDRYHIASLMRKRIASLVLSGSLLVSPALAAQPAQLEPVQAVEAWYKVLNGASAVIYSGTVGSGRAPFTNAYQLLAPALRNQVSEEAFEQNYAQLAHMKLLQAHLARLDKNAREADVFVEEERTMVFDRTATPPGISAVAWYEGTLHLTETSGAWRIAAFSLKPEDIIFMQYGGHMPWLGDPVEVAQVATSAPPYAQPNQPCSSAEPKVESGVAEVEICGDRRYVARLVKLHSGVWRVLSIEPPSTRAMQ